MKSWGQKVTIELPAEVAAAVRAEALRSGVSVPAVVRAVLRSALPGFVGQALEWDLRPVIDIPHSAQRPEVGASDRASEPLVNAVPSLPAGRPDRAPVGDVVE